MVWVVIGVVEGTGRGLFGLLGGNAVETYGPTMDIALAVLASGGFVLGDGAAENQVGDRHFELGGSLDDGFLLF